MAYRVFDPDNPDDVRDLNALPDGSILINGNGSPYLLDSRDGQPGVWSWGYLDDRATLFHDYGVLTLIYTPGDEL